MIAARRPMVALLMMLSLLAGCSTFKDQVAASRQLTQDCAALSGMAAPAPESVEEYVGALQARVWPSLSTCPILKDSWAPGGTGPTPLLACGLRQKFFSQTHFSQTQTATVKELAPVRTAAANVETAAGAVQTAWNDLGAALAPVARAEKAGVTKGPSQTYGAWLRGREGVAVAWSKLDEALRNLVAQVDALESATRAVSLSPSSAAAQAELLAYAANARASIAKARTAFFDETGVARQYLTGKISENFATRYLTTLDRSLVPLERGFERFDEKAYGLGTLLSATASNTIDEALYDSYKAVAQSLCGKQCEPTLPESHKRSDPDGIRKLDPIVRELVLAVGRDACKRMDAPVEATRAPMLMQYAYRFHVRMAADTYREMSGPQADPDTSKSGAASALESSAGKEVVVLRQQTQHAVAEWTLRDALLVQDLSDQIARALPGAAGVPTSVLAARVSESGIEAQARAIAAERITEGWAQAGATTDGDRAARFTATMTVQNNISVSQQVAVHVVNQQSVVNNIRIDAPAPAAAEAGRIRFDPAVIQVNLPGREASAEPVCERGAHACVDLADGFRWTIGGYGLGAALPPDSARAELQGVLRHLSRAQQIHPQRRLRVEVHGFASDEVFSCATARRAASGKPHVAAAYAPACDDAAGNANPLLSFLRARHVWNELRSQVPAGAPVHFAPPMAQGDFLPASARAVEVRVFAVP